MMKEIHAKATAGVYSEVMNQIYDSFDKRIREAISNASDAKATKVTISVFLGNDTKMLIRDNGYGMKLNMCLWVVEINMMMKIALEESASVHCPFLRLVRR